MRVKIAILILALAASTPIFAEGRVVGSTSTEDGTPLTKVVLKLVPTTDTDLPTIQVKSNKKGKFAFGMVRPGDYRLIALVDGMRVVRIDVNLEEPSDESVWAYEGKIPPGTKLPDFTMTGLTTASYDLWFKKDSGGPGEFGTGQAISTVGDIIALIENGESEKAMEEIERNLEADPESATFHYLHAYALVAESKPDEALTAIEKTLENDPSFEGAAFLKGRILEQKGDLDGAIELYQQEADTASSVQVQTDALLSLAIAFENQDRKEDAIEALERVIELAPDAFDAYKELASLYLQTGQQDKAREMMDQVTAMGETDPNILYNLGAERFNEGEHQAAADYFLKAIEAKPDFADAHLRLGYCRISLGDVQGAVECFEKYLEINPEGPDAPTAKAMLDRFAGK
jgi:tetratricopeptide (TPR) repeat protein